MSSDVSLQELQKVIKHLQGNDYETIYINKQMGNEIITLINNMKLYNELLENKINKAIEYLEEVNHNCGYDLLKILKGE